MTLARGQRLLFLKTNTCGKAAEYKPSASSGLSEWGKDCPRVAAASQDGTPRLPSVGQARRGLGPYCTMLCCTVLCGTTLLRHTPPHHTALRDAAMLRHAVLYAGALSQTALLHTALAIPPVTAEQTDYRGAGRRTAPEMPASSGPGAVSQHLRRPKPLGCSHLLYGL